jgi:hypothetical protein
MSEEGHKRIRAIISLIISKENRGKNTPTRWIKKLTPLFKRGKETFKRKDLKKLRP